MCVIFCLYQFFSQKRNHFEKFALVFFVTNLYLQPSTLEDFGVYCCIVFPSLFEIILSENKQKSLKIA